MRVLVLLAALTSAAHADVANEAVLGSYTRALRSDSANAITGDSLGGPAFGYARRIPLRLVPKLELWGTAEMLFGFADGQMFQTITTDLEMMQFAAGVRARYPVWRFVSASARLDVGTERVDLEMRDMAGHEASDTGWGATATAALGLDVTPLALRRFSLGMRAELGYVAASGIGLTAKSDGAPADTLELDRMAASLGHLDIGGRYFSFTVTTRF